MTAFEAWKILGFDPNDVFSKISSKPRQERIMVAENFLELARVKSKKLMAKNHPDMGGRQEKFILIGEAMRFLEEETKIFKMKMESIIKQDELKDSKTVKLVFKLNVSHHNFFNPISS